MLVQVAESDKTPTDEFSSTLDSPPGAPGDVLDTTGAAVNGHGKGHVEMVRNVAIRFVAAGKSVVPILPNGEKKPAGKWKALQENLPTESEINSSFRNGRGIALICGKVSGNHETIDNDDPALVAPFERFVELLAPGLLARLAIVGSPRGDNGGRHYHYRCTEITIPGNTELAKTELQEASNADGTPKLNKKTGEELFESKTLIETRGEGGYILVPGCPGACHPTGLPYKHLSGPPVEHAPIISAKERNILWIAARKFNRYFDGNESENSDGSKGQRDGLKPGDDYNQRATFDEMLEPAGWVKESTRGEITYWCRPGKDHGTSATTGLRSANGVEQFCVHSSNAHPFNGGQSYSKFGVYAVLKHRGDFRAATKALATAGYGDKPKSASMPAAVGEPQSVDLRESASRTDTANARRFAAQHGRDVRYCDLWVKWFDYDGKYWPVDKQRHIDARAKMVVDDIWREVSKLLPEIENASLQRELIRFAQTTASARGIGNMLALVRSEPGIPVMPESLDRDPWLLNLENGTLDLHAGKLREHRREDMITKRAPVAFDPAATCPLFEKFLNDIFAGNTALIRYVQQLVGYSLTGVTRDHVMPFLYGDGSNGKSTFVKTILALLGDDYSGKAAQDLLLAKKGESHPTDKADLHGKRFIAASETEDGRRLAESLLKDLTGDEPVKAQAHAEDFWQFTATHKIWLSGNYKPTIRGQDHGIWRRVKLIPFCVKFEGNAIDSKLPEKLLTELPGVLNWALAGCLHWQAEGLIEPGEVTDATANYKRSEDVLGSFLDECYELDRVTKVAAADVRMRYENWCGSNGESPANRRVFGDYLTSRGVTKEKHGRYVYIGLKSL